MVTAIISLSIIFATKAGMGRPFTEVPKPLLGSADTLVLNQMEKFDRLVQSACLFYDYATLPFQWASLVSEQNE